MSDEPIAIGRDGMTYAGLDPRLISPELVLVDPELAKIARAQLNATAQQHEAAREEISTPTAALEPPVEVAPLQADVRRLETELEALRLELADARVKLLEEPRIERQRRRELMGARVSAAFGVFFSVVLLGSLLMNLGFIGFLVGAPGETPTLSSAAASALPYAQQSAAAQTSFLPPSQVSSSVGIEPNAETKTVATRAAAAVEKRVIAQLLTQRTTRLPSILVDRRTGLLRNNVRIVCHSISTVPRGNFLCIVHPPRAASTTGLYIRYHAGASGSAKLTFLGLRR